MLTRAFARRSRRGRGWLMVPGSLAVLLVGIALVYADILGGLVRQWASDENYSHGFLIAPLAAFFAWRQKPVLARLAPRPARGGLLLVLAALLLLVVGTLGAELFLARVSLLGVLAGGVAWTWGWGHLRRLAFPLAFLLLMIPPPTILFNQVALPLQGVAARMGETTLMMAGVPVLREGNRLVLASMTLEVAEACSGIRSLVSLLTLAVVLAYFSDGGRTSRGVIVAATVPIAIIANGSRVAGTGLVAHAWGSRAADGFFHTFSGWLLFLVAFALLFSVRSMAVWSERRVMPGRASDTCDDGSDGGSNDGSSTGVPEPLSGTPRGNLCDEPLSREERP